MEKVRESHKFPADLWREELIQNGAGPCETIISDDRIEMFLEHGTLVLWADGTWDWVSLNKNRRNSK